MSSRHRKLLIVAAALMIIFAVALFIAHRQIDTYAQNHRLLSLYFSLRLYQNEVREPSPTITIRQLFQSQQTNTESFFGSAINDYGRVQWPADHKPAVRDPLFFRRVGSGSYVVLRNGEVVWDANNQLLKQTEAELKMGPD